MGDQKNTSLVIKRVYDVDRKALFEALTTPEMIEQWFFPTREDGWSVSVDFDPQPGEKYTLTMYDPDGKDYIHSGEFREIEAGRKLVFTWNSHSVEDTLVTISLRDTAGGTELILEHDFMPQDEKKGHKEGWTELLENLSELLTSNKKEARNV